MPSRSRNGDRTCSGAVLIDASSALRPRTFQGMRFSRGIKGVFAHPQVKVRDQLRRCSWLAQAHPLKAATSGRAGSEAMTSDMWRVTRGKAGFRVPGENRRKAGLPRLTSPQGSLLQLRKATTGSTSVTRRGLAVPIPQARDHKGNTVSSPAVAGRNPR